MTTLDERFAALTGLDGGIDWEDVVARSGIGRRRRPILLAASVLALVAAGVVLGTQLGGANAAVPGPTHVERHVPNGTVHWLFAHEPRGLSLERAHISLLSTTGAHWQPVKFARVIEPARGVKVALTLIGKHGRNICLTLYLGATNTGGGCAFGRILQPFSEITMSGLDVSPTGGSVVAGLASDDVTRMALFIHGKRWRRVALVDNAFFVRLEPSDYPANLVAYDAQGRVIGTSARPKPHVLG